MARSLKVKVIAMTVRMSVTRGECLDKGPTGLSLHESRVMIRGHRTKIICARVPMDATGIHGSHEANRKRW